jgi:hypothetical protein
MQTCAPAAANASAITSPMPDAAAVIKTLWFWCVMAVSGGVKPAKDNPRQHGIDYPSGTPNSLLGTYPCWTTQVFHWKQRERVGLIGRNGTGKSSHARKSWPGWKSPTTAWCRCKATPASPTWRRSRSWTPPPAFSMRWPKVCSVVRYLIDEYAQGHGDLDAMQSEIESLDGWNWEQRVGETLQRLHLRLTPSSAPCPAAPKSAWPWRRRWWRNPRRCCSMNPPTIWTWIQLSG